MGRHWLSPRMFLSLVAILLISGCATVNYVKEQLGIRDQKIAQESETRERQVAEVDRKADEATARADQALIRIRDVEGEFSRKFANRNLYVVREARAVYFDFDKAELKDAAITTLVDVGRLLKEDPSTLVELQGHTDSVGTAQYNLQLSRERAAAVVRHLVKSYGVGTHRISLVGFGKETPAADNKTTDGRAQNRRVTVTVLAPEVK